MSTRRQVLSARRAVPSTPVAGIRVPRPCDVLHHLQLRGRQPRVCFYASDYVVCRETFRHSASSLDAINDKVRGELRAVVQRAHMKGVEANLSREVRHRDKCRWFVLHRLFSLDLVPKLRISWQGELKIAQGLSAQVLDLILRPETEE